MSRTPAHPAAQWAQIAIAAPQVVAHRLTRMALAGPTPSARDRREFHLMGAEKSAAFVESWAAMWMQLWTAQQRLAFGWMQALAGVLGHGVAPVRRRAVANARRLRRSRR